MLFQSEEKLIRSLYRGNNKKQKTICNYEQLLTTTTLMDKIGDIIKYIKLLSKKCPNEKIHYIEIGVKYGGVLKYVLENTKNIDIEVIGIDLFENFDICDNTNTHKGDIANKDEMDEKFIEFGYNNVKLYKGDSSTIINEKLSNMKNVVCFIDANHTYYGVKKDYDAILNKMDCGYIIFDDIDPFWPGVNKFYKELSHLEVVNYYYYGIIKINLI